MTRSTIWAGTGTDCDSKWGARFAAICLLAGSQLIALPALSEPSIDLVDRQSSVVGHAIYLPGPCGVQSPPGSSCNFDAQPAAEVEFIVRENNSTRIVTRFATAVDGSFAFPLNKGRYTIHLLRPSMHLYLKHAAVLNQTPEVLDIELGLDWLRP